MTPIRHPRRFRATGAAVSILVCAGLALSQLSSVALCAAEAQTPEPAPTTTPNVAKLRAELAERIARLASFADSIEATDGQPATVAASAELNELRNLDLVYLQRESTLEQISDAEREAAHFREELQ